MASYGGDRNYGANRNFMSSFPRNNYGSASEDQSMYMRRPFERDTQMYQRYDDTRTGSFSSRPQPSFSRFDEQSRGTFSSVDRPMSMANAGNVMANRATSQNTFSRSGFGGQDFQRPEFGGKSAFRGSDLDDRSAFPRSDLGNREMYVRSEFTRNGMFSRPQVGSSSMASRLQVGDGSMYSRPSAGGSVQSRPVGSGNMFSRPQLSSSGGMFSRRPQFDGNPMSSMPMNPPRMQFPYSGGANQRSPASLEWNSRPDWRSRSSNSGVSAQKKPFAATQQNKPKFKPAKKKSKKRNRIPSKLKDDGKKLKPWMTDELFAEVKKKNEMYFKAKAADSTELWQEFRLQRNKVSSLIKDAKVKGGFLVRRKKEDEEDGTEKPYSCDTCDRAFAEESKLEEHLKEHKKCEIDGCQFEAHPKVVEVHRKMQHETGYANIISKLHNADEIEKWRNERKSHFPSLENVKKRQAEQEERFARGEVLQTKDFGSKNEVVKDGSQDPPQTQQDTSLPEGGGEDKEGESDQVKTDTQMEN